MGASASGQGGVVGLLLVGGDHAWPNLLAEGLACEGFEITRVRDGQRAISSVRDGQHGIIVIGIPLPDLDGLELCRRLRGMTDVPVVLLNSEAREAEIVRALELGADEYLSTPIRPRELAARLRALLRRANGTRADAIEGQLVCGDLEVNLGERRVYKRGRLVELSPIEFRLLVSLLREAGRVVSHRKLMVQVWGGEYVDCRHYLRLYVRYLRSKLEDDPKNPKTILSEWGIGYRFEPTTSPKT